MRRPHWPRRVFAQLLLGQTVVTLGVTALTAGLLLAPVSHELDRNAMDRALSIALATAADETIARAAAERDSATAQRNAEQIRVATHASFVVVTDAAGLRLSHTDPARIGQRVSTDPGPALNGRSVTAIEHGTLGRTARGKVPLRLADGRIVGEVSVGISDRSIRGQLLGMTDGIALCAGTGLVVGTAATLLLARRLKRRTHNIAVADISALLIEREAMLHGIREGVVALDARGRIRLANDEARRLLALPEDCTGRPVDEVLPPGRPADVLAGRVTGADLPAVRGEQVLLMNRMATADGGAVTTLRDRTELESLVRELDHTRSLTEALRAQDHEHANRLHTLLGLLELGLHDQAAQYLCEESGTQAAVAARIAEQVQDPHVAALLAGKTAVAAERGARLTVTHHSHLPDAVADARMLAAVLGNLLDNALESTARSVEVALRADGPRLRLTVSDDGPGVPPELRDRVFEEGWSSKQAPAHRPRGLGLPLVRRQVERAGGSVTVGRSATGGAEFTVLLPEALLTAPPTGHPDAGPPAPASRPAALRSVPGPPAGHPHHPHRPDQPAGAPR
ncbi:ATP-binding protein [Kitasatospora sp. NPDC051853]|uniref:sensor histidine kinase n=1 Tax=Kitasatospora sp. NPDC051853 TaxID=3364058 RepID=UPI0037A46537